MSTVPEIKIECFLDDIEANIIKELSASKESIKICVAWINLSRFEDLLLKK